MTHWFFGLYQRLVLHRPTSWLLLIAAISIAAAFGLRGFHLDASSESLVLEHDKALEYYRGIAREYGGSDFLVVTYTPRDAALFSRAALTQLDALHQDLQAVPEVASVYSALDVPLLFSPPTSFSSLAQGYRTLRSDDVDLSLARQEFLEENPIYKGLLASRDGNTTALLLQLARDEEYFRLLNRRDDLIIESAKADDPAVEAELAEARKAYSAYNTQRQARQAEMIAEVRSILDRHRQHADMFLGGVPMIATDTIAYVRSDLETFGIGVLVFILVSLLVIFRQPRWAALSLACCAIASLWLSGWLGFVGWKVTVISSNYLSLMLIITMSITIHLIVRFRELQQQHPGQSQDWLVNETVRHMARPSIYMILTTMVGFGSLALSDIRPVEDFGWMMTIGIGGALALCYLLFPAFLKQLKPVPVIEGRDLTGKLTHFFAVTTERFHRPLLLVALVLVAVSVAGMSRLTVENRFIDYFQEDTEIHQGMMLIDRKLGGTTPLDIIIDAPAEHLASASGQGGEDPFADPFADPFEKPAAEADPFADPFAADGFSGNGFSNDAFEEGAVEKNPLEDAYWYTPLRLKKLVEIQNWLDDMPEVGKVLSLATTYEAAEKLNGQPLNYVQLMLLSSFIPADLRKQMVSPYLSDDGNQVRIMARIIDSDPDLKRDELLKRVEAGLVENFDLAPDQVHLTGAMVLYNNLLQSLFDSQIKTMGLVFCAIFAMLVILIRSLPLALISMGPSLVSAGMVLGLMGWIGLPLDLMTITIAAITVGIAVDDTIHYVHRFREEFPQDQNYICAMHRCHASIGKAMYYTSITIIVGFSILALSNFNPTVYFGLLTGLAMLMALLCNLTLLPALLVTFKPKIPALN
ncbi:MAG: MMPL family transporter [Alcanivoracaceae bacterium]|nr:MMPL family transporter [Alcanivoracaceae bacterium]